MYAIFFNEQDWFYNILKTFKKVIDIYNKIWYYKHRVN